MTQFSRRLFLGGTAAAGATALGLATPSRAEAATRTNHRIYLSGTAFNLPGEGPRNRAIPQVRISNYNAKPTQGDHDFVLNAGSASPVKDWSTINTVNPDFDGSSTLVVLLNRNTVKVGGKSYGAGKVLVGAVDNYGTQGGWITWQQSGITKLEAAEGDSDAVAQILARVQYSESNTSAESVIEYFGRTAGLTSLI